MIDSVIMRLDKASIVKVLHDEPKFSEAFMAHLLTRNARVEEDLLDQLFNSSEKRLARVLLLMANFGKEAKPERVIAKVSQETPRADYRHYALTGEHIHEISFGSWASSNTMALGSSQLFAECGLARQPRTSAGFGCSTISKCVQF